MSDECTHYACDEEGPMLPEHMHCAECCEEDLDTLRSRLAEQAAMAESFARRVVHRERERDGALSRLAEAERRVGNARESERAAQNDLAGAQRRAAAAEARCREMEAAARRVCEREVRVRENPYGRADDFHAVWREIAALRALLSDAPPAPPESAPAGAELFPSRLCACRQFHLRAGVTTLDDEAGNIHTRGACAPFSAPKGTP